ncbi:hypothetical protein MG296_09530 [Flavobacteriaceae bacterium TK19130]|nr:hypothetical protein [Thermobacterium salinum]
MGYFNIYRNQASTEIYKSEGNAETNKAPHSIFQWLALLLGVLIEPFFSYFSEHATFHFKEAYTSNYFWVFALIVAIVTFPSVYRSAFDDNKPKWVQMIPIFTAGLGWQTLVKSVAKASTASDSEVTTEGTTFLIQSFSEWTAEAIQYLV